MQNEIDKLKELSDEWKKKLDKITQDIRDVESAIKDSALSRDFEVCINEHNSLIWDSSQRRLMGTQFSTDLSLENGKEKPLLEWNIQFRQMAHPFLSEVLKKAHKTLKKQIDCEEDDE